MLKSNLFRQVKTKKLIRTEPACIVLTYSKYMTINNKRSLPISLLARATAMVWLLILLTSASSTPPHIRTVQFEYKAVVPGTQVGTNKLEIWLPVPQNSPFQLITKLDVSAPYPYTIDTTQYGNRVLHLSLLKPASKEVIITMRFTAVRKEHIQPLAGSSSVAQSSAEDPYQQRWLQADRLVPIDGTIKMWAKQVVDSVGAKTDLQRAKAIYDHVIATVKYDKTGSGWGRGDIYYACDTRRGNCTDFHALFIGYCRALGIPARFAIGFSLPTEQPAGQIQGYHCWAEFYNQKVGWIPIDASEAAKNPARRSYYFGAHDENRLEFSLGRDIRLHSNQANPLNYFIYPYAEADGTALAGITSIITYRNLNQ